MHRATPLNSSFRAYSAGGARATIPTVDDSKLMQESTDTQGMKSEKTPAMESPQNYGFTSVVADADRSGNPGHITASAEGFISYMGGNRSFPVMMGGMDDRRHRLMNLAKDAAKGSTAMFGLKEWGQQLLNTKDGWFMTGNTEKKMKLQLVDNKNGQQQGGGGGGAGGGGAGALSVVTPLADGGGGGGGGGAGGGAGGGQSKGQKSLHKEDSKTYVEMTKDAVHTLRGDGHVKVQDKVVTTHYKDDTKSTRCDEQHVHIRFSGSNIWVDGGGCWSSKPIKIRTCSDANSGSSRLAKDGVTVLSEPGPIESGPPAYYTDPPLSIDDNAKMTLAYKAPLFVDTDGKLTVGATGGAKRLLTQVDKTNSTLADLTELAIAVAANTPYGFRAVLFSTLNTTGGGKIALGGTATATDVLMYQSAFADGANTVVMVTKVTVLGSSFSSVTANTSIMWTIEGTILTNGAGTLVPQFAQATASGTSSVLRGSYFQVWPF